MLRFAVRPRLLVGAVLAVLRPRSWCSRPGRSAPISSSARSTAAVETPARRTPTTTSRSSTAARAGLAGRDVAPVCERPAPGNFGGNAAMLTELSGSLAPGQYLLVQEASNAPVGAPLPTPDIVDDATPILMAAGRARSPSSRGRPRSAVTAARAPCDAAALARIVDLVGYGNANFEGPGAAPTISATLAAFRAGGGCVDRTTTPRTFSGDCTPNPRNTVSPLGDCSSDAVPAISSISPATVRLV